MNGEEKLLRQTFCRRAGHKEWCALLVTVSVELPKQRRTSVNCQEVVLVAGWMQGQVSILAAAEILNNLFPRKKVQCKRDISIHIITRRHMQTYAHI